VERSYVERGGRLSSPSSTDRSLVPVLLLVAVPELVPVLLVLVGPTGKATRA
jgi:hypothetical protein